MNQTVWRKEGPQIWKLEARAVAVWAGLLAAGFLS